MSFLQQTWQHHVNVWQTTQLSQAQYCRIHDLDQSQFSYWKRKFNRVNSVTKSVTSKFTLAQVETAKLNGLEPYRYLHRLLTQQPHVETLEQIEALLPWNLAKI